MKTSKPTLAALLIAIVIGAVHSVNATSINIQLAPFQALTGSATGVIRSPNFVYARYGGLAGIPFAGQQLSLNFILPANEFIRIYTETMKHHGLGVELFPAINKTITAPPSLTDTAYITGSSGNVLSPLFSVSDFHDTGVEHLYFNLLTLNQSPPADFYGVHLNLTLPVDPGVMFTGNGTIIFSGLIFDVGQGPRDIVAETGGTFGLLTLAFAMLLGVRWLFPALARAAIS